MGDNKLYVGHLDPSCTEENIREAFEKIGAISQIDMKNGFCFVTFEDAANADIALKDLHNAAITGSSSLNVQVAKGPRPERREEPRKMQDRYRILIENVVPEASWMDLKDFARDRGVVANYADVRVADGKATGVLAFPTIEETEEAIKKLDGQSMLGNALTVSKDENYVPKEARPRVDGRGPSGDRYDDRRRDIDRRDYDRRDYERRDYDRRDYDRRDYDRRDYDRRDYDRRDYDRRDYDRRDYDRRDYDGRDFDRRPPVDYGRGRDDFRAPPPRGGDYYPDRERDRYPAPPGGGYDRGGRYDRSPPRRSPPRRSPPRRSPPRGPAGGGSAVCYAFQRGECNRGDTCRFSHVGVSSER